MPSTSANIGEFIDYCQRVYEGNPVELKTSKDFGLTYYQNRALWCNDFEEKTLTKLLEWMRKEIGKENDLLTLGYLLFKSGKLEEAEQFYRRLLHENSEIDKLNISYCYQALGDLATEKGDYDEAIVRRSQTLDL
ncbi:unnamed protein product [Rotaria sp. Silwood1]|nr:unnamed protein product [Rotaria sp. Silwood1]CAF3691602.1 unnamed protein product [Rotaria sp. Silwood1]CAF5005888.1 unnamed protein product [Rotaria sp. Silwood1]CAF5043916.1 unnamed protein product [Rotaria sp. Silwood1]